MACKEKNWPVLNQDESFSKWKSRITATGVLPS
jgi:hypothetical protein